MKFIRVINFINLKLDKDNNRKFDAQYTSEIINDLVKDGKAIGCSLVDARKIIADNFSSMS